MIDTASILAQFRTAAEARGLRLPDRIDADGKLHRCELQDGPKGKNDGAYLLHLDGVPAGGFQNFKDGRDWENWRADIGRSLTPEEEAANRARLEAQRAAREAEAKAKREKARRKAHALWNSAKPAPDDHPYLQRKGVPSFGLRVGTWPKWREVRPGEWREERIPNALLLPMRSPSGTLHSLQAIYAEKLEDLEKCFLTNGEKLGKLHLIGELTERLPLCVAEGYATAATVYLATNWPVAVAFDAGSLEPVARALRDAHPGARFIICADDDHQTAGNPGRTKAEAAARAVGGVVAVPEFGPDRPERATDFNDLHALAGLDAVRAILEAAAASIPAPQAHETPDAAPTPAPEADTPTSGPETAPAAPSDEPEKPAKRTRKPKAKAAPAPTGGEVFELRDGNDGRGVYRLKVERRGEGWETVEQFVCAPLEITHQVRDARGENWQRLATFNDHDGRRRRVLVPDEMLEGDGSTLARLLRQQGLFIGDNRGGLLKMYVNRSRPDARARLTTRIGWHDDVSEPGRWSFVLSGDVDPLAAPGAELWLHQAQGSGHAQFKSAGTLADWRDNVAALAVGNSRAVFALSAGFAGGLCWLHPNISGGFHWAGGSSLGKSSLLYAAASLLGWLASYLLNNVVVSTIADLRSDVEAKIHRLPLRYYDEAQRGDLLSRVTNDLDNLSQTVQQTIMQLLNSVLMVIGILAMMLWISPLLSIIALLTIPAAGIATAMIAKRSKPHFLQQWKSTGTLNAQIEEAFTGHELVTVFGRQRQVMDAFDDRNEKLYNASWRAQFISGIVMPTIMFLGNVNYVAVAVVGGLRVASGSLSLGEV